MVYFFAERVSIDRTVRYGHFRFDNARIYFIEFKIIRFFNSIPMSKKLKRVAIMTLVDFIKSLPINNFSIKNSHQYLCVCNGFRGNCQDILIQYNQVRKFTR